jgi:hypothetical protein
LTRYRVKRGFSIGSLAAENDALLHEAFVDSGYIDRLCNPDDHAFLLLGRSGSGKTALVRQMIETRGQDHVTQLDPDELSMQYLQNSVLREIRSWDVNLEIFYKYLWRHVCILSLARLRYEDPSTLPNKISALAGFKEMFFGDDPKTREAKKLAQSYISKYSDTFWITTDTKIKKIASEMETQLRRDSSVGARLGSRNAGAEGKLGRASSSRAVDKVEEEVVARAQEIVSSFQIADLNRVVDAVTKYSFEEEPDPYFLVIDDLDKEWMPDDDLYLDLLKSLLLTVRELNYRLKNAKIVIALREDIYQRVYQRTSRQQSQREKWVDVQVSVRWSKDQLVDLVNRRLAAVFRGQYTQTAPNLEDLLPQRKRKPNEEDALDYIVERTLMRPRDIIDFINRCFNGSAEIVRLTWSDMRSAEVGYSEARLQAIVDEWANCYLGLPATFALLSRVGPRFTPDQITDEDILSILVDHSFARCEWLKGLGEMYSKGASFSEARSEILQAWFTAGLVGIKDPISHRLTLSLDRAFVASTDTEPDRAYVVLNIVRPALGVNGPRSSER